MQELLKELVEKHRKTTELGKVASYIPELEKTNPRNLGIYILDNEEMNILLEIMIINLQFKVFLK